VSVYLDSSVVLRVVLNAPEQLIEWRRFHSPVASALLEVECYRTLARVRASSPTPEEVDRRSLEIARILSAVHLIDLTPAILYRAAQSFPVVLKTLDALHLATAMAWREQNGDLGFATHDLQLARAARETGFNVLGA
jgi:predicted nucleic acid-binding protein